MTTKRARSKSPPSPLPSAHDIPAYSTFSTRGWVRIPNVLSPSELRLLQSECSELYARESVESIAAQGCVLDGMAQCPIRDSDLARVNSKYYLQARSKQLQSKHFDMEIFASLLFEKLPAIAGQLMASCGKTETGTNVFFFNEHYVVKPPRSCVEFRWHRDDDEQLAMCVHRDEILPYVSAWCALNDVTEVNGALQFVSLDSLSGSDGETIEKLGCLASEPVTAKAGDALFFLSNVWHCSSSNESDGARRAFYAQYSRERITARPNDPAPLSFAIPCRELSSVDELTRNGSDRANKKSKH